MKNYTGSDLRQDFKTFFSKEKSRISKILKDLGCTDIQMSRQFYYFYGFFTSKSGQTYYFCCSDVRHFGYNQIRYKIAKDYKDYGGSGMNQYVNIDNIKEMELI